MAKNATVFVGCKLPHGIRLEISANPFNFVDINGLNRATIIGAEYATTEVDAEFWVQWLAENKDFPVLTAGALFAANDLSSLAAKAREVSKEITGFEPMPQTVGELKPATP